MIRHLEKTSWDHRNVIFGPQPIAELIHRSRAHPWEADRTQICRRAIEGGLMGGHELIHQRAVRRQDGLASLLEAF
jgi:hypothetical protein